MRIIGQEQAAQLDRMMVERAGLSEISLMRNAGRMIVDAMHHELRIPKTSRIGIVAGPGNNGGDGFAAAYLLKQEGYSNLKVFHSTSVKSLNPAPLFFYQMLSKIRKIDISSTELVHKHCEQVMDNDIVVDAVFGSGVHRDITGHFAEIISLINNSAARVISIDLPSGYFSDQNIMPKTFVHADVTLCIALPKLPLVLHPMKEYRGRLFVRNIGFTDDFLREVSSTLCYYGDEDSIHDFPPRPTESHKNMFGHLAIWAGSEGKSGAAFLSGLAAMRTGAGLVTMLCNRDIYHILACKMDEAMVLPMGDPLNSQLQKYCQGKTALLVGPGLGVSDEKFAALSALFDSFKGPVILDADALNMVANFPEVLSKVFGRAVLTPHLGEMGRLLGRKIDNKVPENMQAVSNFAKEYGAIIVLKSADTRIFSPAGVDPEGDIWVNGTGNAGLAKAGSGDVLAGIIAGMISQTTSLRERGVKVGSLLHSVLFGVWLHGKAADLAIVGKDVRSLLATDVIDYIGNAYADLAERALFSKNYSKGDGRTS